MSDERIERAIEGVLAVADSNFPSITDVQVSALGKNTASVTISSYELRGIITLAKSARLVTSVSATTDASPKGDEE